MQKMLPYAYITHALAQTTPLLSKPCDKSNGVFSKTVLPACRCILTGKHKDSVG